MMIRFMNDGDRLSRVRQAIDYRITPRLSAGIEHDGVTEVYGRFTWFACVETDRTPSVTLGLSADRHSIPRGQAAFVTLSKEVPKTGIHPFVSLKYSTDEKSFAVPFGANMRLDDKWTLQGLYDGNYTHVLATTPTSFGSLSLMLGKMKHPGITFTFSW